MQPNEGPGLLASSGAIGVLALILGFVLLGLAIVVAVKRGSRTHAIALCAAALLPFLLGCVGAWSLHPVQIEIAKKVFSPDPDEVLFAKKVIEAIPDGKGVHMIDGKMQDDATWKQAKVIVDLAQRVARKDPERATAYGF